MRIGPYDVIWWYPTWDGFWFVRPKFPRDLRWSLMAGWLQINNWRERPPRVPVGWMGGDGINEWNGP